MPMPWPLVVACCIGMFAATASGSTRSPFLLDMAADLNASLPAIANLFGVTSVAWGLSAYAAGRASDRFGRRVFLVGAPAVLALALVGMAQAGSYWTLFAWVAFGGLACGSFTASAMAEVSLRVAGSQRGRALGWVMSGQSLTLLIGVPLSAWLGAFIGWRGVHGAIGALALGAAVLLFVCSAPAPITAAGGSGRGDAPRTTLGEALTGPVIRLFCALVVERVTFGLSAFYYPAFLRTAYDLDIQAVAGPLLGFAAGNIAGTVLGGQLADRYPYRRLSFAVMLAVSGGFALVWFGWTPSVGVTVALGVGFSFFNALGRPPLLAAMADVPPEVRGVIMGLNSSIASIGWLTAAVLGGWLYAGLGFGAFGPLMSVMCLLGAALVVRDSRIRQRFE